MLRTSERTDVGVLPQPRPLESVLTDPVGPGVDPDVARTRYPTRNTGAQLGRGETAAMRRHSPKADEPAEAKTGGFATPTAGAGAVPRPAAARVFVLDRHRTPLMPCHPARARQLLAKGRAVVARHTPLVIRLRDKEVSECQVDGVEVGVDPGSRHTGIAVFGVDETGSRGSPADV